MNDLAFQQRELTLMFTDIVGYSRLMGRDQAQTIGMLEDYRRILLEQIGKQNGTVIEFIGDAVFARFDTPLAAVTAAVSIQKELFSFNHFRDKSLPRLQTRIGLHTGEVATKGDAVFGDDVNIAARLEPIAVADGICISKAVYDAVKENLKEPILSLGVQPLKNIESKIRAYLIRPLGITFKTRVHYFNRKLNQKLGAYRYPIAAAIVMVIISLFYWVPRWLVPGYDANYVEIADFQNLMNAGGEADYLSSGITEAVRSQLADVRDVYLVKSGEGILAPVMLEGSVQKVGDNLRIAYQLIRRKGKVQIAGGKLDGKYDEIFILQDRVVGEVAKHLAEEFRIPNFRPARVNTTSDVLAYDYYMRGLDYLGRPNSINNTDEAIKFFTTALVHDSRYTDAEAGLCQAYVIKYRDTLDTSWLLEAKKHCEIALNLDSNQPEAIESMGVIYSSLGKHEKAIELLTNVLEGDEKNLSAATSLANVYQLSGDTEKAKATLKKIMQHHEKSWFGHQMLGWVYLVNGELENSISAYEEVLKLTPENSTAFSNIGIAFLHLGDFKRAEKSFRRAAEIQPSSWAYSNIGLTDYYLGRFEEAAKIFKLAIKLDPDDYELRLNYADTLMQLKFDEDELRDAYEIARNLAVKNYDLNQEDPYVNYTLSMCYLYKGDVSASKFHIEKALGSLPNDPYILYGKLRIEIAVGNEEEAVETLGEMLSLGYSLVFVEADPILHSVRNMTGYGELASQY